jgi:hypothetical protein
MDEEMYYEQGSKSHTLRNVSIVMGAVCVVGSILVLVFFFHKKDTAPFSPKESDMLPIQTSTPNVPTQDMILEEVQAQVFVSVPLRKKPAEDPIPEDVDRDGLTAAEEEMYKTNPLVFDTDGDGLSDGEEVRIGTNPTLRDTDGDGFADGWEILQGHSPTSTR